VKAPASDSIYLRDHYFKMMP